MFNCRRWLSACAGLLLLLAFSTTCFGDLIIEVQDAQIAYGGSGYVDVLISSDGSDNLAAFSADLKITTADTANGGIRFGSPVIDASTVTSPFSYVFFGDSIGYTVNPTNGSFPDNEVNVSDATSSFTNVTVDSTKRLLTRLLVTHTGGTFAAVGETFTVGFLSGDFLDDSFLTGPGLAAAGQKYTGTITIVTPEPTTGGVLLCGGVGVVLWRRLRRHSRV